MPCVNPTILFRCGPRVFYSLKSAIDAGESNSLGIESLKVRCGKCLDCRLNYSRVWASRCVAELSNHSASCFVTLTYSDSSLPVSGSGESTLRLSDLQKFFKRLRKFTRLRYFACGEYGSRTHRPHYHAILFGYRPSDLVYDYVSTDSGLSKVASSEFLNRTWSLGNVSIGDVTSASCAYVARYCVKKLDSVELGTRSPEFVVMSRRPAIGSEFMARNKASILEYDSIFDGKKWTKPPRVFENFLTPSEIESLRQRRKVHVVDLSTDELLRKYKYTCEVWKKERSF